MKVVKVDAESGEGPVIRVKRNQNVAIDVPGGGTTGYLWEVVDPPAGLKVHGHTIEPDLESFGGKGTDRFVVSASRQGSHEMKIELKRPWDRTPAKSVNLKIAAD